MKKNIFKGNFFINEHQRNLFCLNKKGNLRNVKLNLKLNTNTSLELQYVGIMQFCVDDKHHEENHCVILTDQEGEIKSLTKKAEKYFRDGEKIFEYNKKFKKIYQVKKLK